MLITFSGLDGAGKSTLIDRLKRTLESQNRPVTVYHMNDHVGIYAYARAVRNGLFGRRSSSVAVSTNNGRHPITAAGAAPSPGHQPSRGIAARVRYAIVWNKTLRRFIYPLDLLVFLCYRLYVENVRKRILIMDRYFYDTLVDVSDGRRWRWIRLLNALTPAPSVAVFLDITPEESYARKGEYTVEYLRRRWKAYMTVQPWVRTSLLLDSSDLDETAAALRRVVLERLPAP